MKFLLLKSANAWGFLMLSIVFVKMEMIFILSVAILFQ